MRSAGNQEQQGQPQSQPELQPALVQQEQQVFI